MYFQSTVKINGSPTKEAKSHYIARELRERHFYRSDAKRFFLFREKTRISLSARLIYDFSVFVDNLVKKGELYKRVGIESIKNNKVGIT